MENQSFTAFPKTEERLRERIQSVEWGLFENYRQIPCSSVFQQCRGICCSLKVAVTQEELAVLRQLLKDQAVLFREMGIRIRKDIAAIDPETGFQCLAKKRRGFSELNKIIHGILNRNGPFGLNWKTLRNLLYACVFLMKDGTCALQRISERLGQHRWFYKPVNCWKYPFGIADATLILPDPKDHPHFPCYRGKGLPVREACAEELALLSGIIRRDLADEFRKILPKNAEK
ncbi:MAG TPA: hypothetical protein PKL97_02855 [Candidatus Omnitrophota bacterium]|nr:hypothetical protein [Candidatus Omnitrophota bacterium]